MGIDGCIHDGWLLIRNTYGVFDLTFLCHLLGTPQMLSQYRSLAAGSTVNNLNKELVGNTVVTIPSITEQRVLGDYLEQLDNLITLHQRKYDKLVAIKRSMLEKMFPREGSRFPEIRFAGFTDPWEQRKLGDLVQFSKGTGYSKGDLGESGTPIILYGRLYTQYETVIAKVDTFADPKAGSVYSRGGEVIVPASGETAEDISIASVVEKSGVLLGGDLNIITPPADLDAAFLAISISNGKPHEDMAKMAQGKSVVHLHNTDLEKIDLTFPCLDEQTQISGYFGAIDRLITLHQREQNYKKEALMSYTLTKYEKETVLLYNQSHDPITISTYDPGLRRRMREFAARYPELCRRVDKQKYPDYAEYEIQKERVSIRLLPPMSEEKRRVASEKAKAAGLGTKGNA